MLSLIFEFPANNSKFKFQVHDSFLEYFFWRFKKHIYFAWLADNSPMNTEKISTHFT